MSYYIKNNEIYIHCIGKKGDILKYTIDDYKLEKDIMELDYKDAPNISQIHILIDGADNDYIYLRSNVKNNDSIKEGEFVKCLLSTKKCEYYNGNRVSDIEVEKTENQNLNKFNIYLERDSRIIYLSSLLEEVYLNKNENKITLKDYISKSYQTLDDSINHVTDSMIKTETLRDGGTIIYKNEIFDITLVKCNTTKGNKDIFIGDYKMKFDDESMCNR
jgi:CRISPR/Cas system CMR-associated protein Cmr5 small subunit